jgi:thiosulfate/3-mercaptopyruvate sulfurtransferase
MTYTTLINPDELASLLDDPRANVLVCDCSFDLANPDAGLGSYDEAHIPGAVYMHLDRDLSGPKTGLNGRHPLPTLDAFVAVLRRAGASDTTQIVACDRAGGMYAARLWWLLRWAGHRACAVLDGGLGGWEKHGLPLESGKAAARAPGSFSARAPLVTTVDFDDVQANIAAGKRVVLDARAADRFRGENETLDAIGGHIPQARNRFFRDNLDADGRFKPASVLRSELVKIAGTDVGENIIGQCGSGVTACHNLLALEVAGIGNAALYPGSWSEWSSRAGAPVAQGE